VLPSSTLVIAISVAVITAIAGTLSLSVLSRREFVALTVDGVVCAVESHVVAEASTSTIGVKGGVVSSDVGAGGSGVGRVQVWVALVVDEETVPTSTLSVVVTIGLEVVVTADIPAGSN
jgi:hypothetical protein